MQTFSPAEQTEQSREYTLQLAYYVQVVMGGYAGLATREGVLSVAVFGVLIPLAMGAAWAALLWFFAATTVWLLLLTLVCALLVMDVYLIYRAGWAEPSFDLDHLLGSALLNRTLASAAPHLTSPWLAPGPPLARNASSSAGSLVSRAVGEERTWFIIGAVLCSLLTVLLVVFLVAHRKCIKRLIAILRESSRALKSMVAIVVWPLFNVTLSAGVLAFGLFMSYFMPQTWETHEAAVGILIFLWLVVFWSRQLVKAIVYTSMSTALSKWFVGGGAKGGGSGRHASCGLCSLAGGTWLVLRKHLGSMIFGALVLAVVQLMRLLVGLIDWSARKAQSKSRALALCLRCVHYMLGCLKSIIEFVSYYGFVLVGMRGNNFCRACRSSFGILLAHPAQTAINRTVQWMLRILVGLSSPLLCTFFAMQYLQSADEGAYAATHNPAWAAFVVLVASYVVTDAMVTVYNCAIDTIYLCAFIDMMENQPPKFMSDGLRRGFGLSRARDDGEGKAGSEVEREEERKAVVGEVEDGSDRGFEGEVEAARRLGSPPRGPPPTPPPCPPRLYPSPELVTPGPAKPRLAHSASRPAAQTEPRPAPPVPPTEPRPVPRSAPRPKPPSPTAAAEREPRGRPSSTGTVAWDAVRLDVDAEALERISARSA